MASQRRQTRREKAANQTPVRTHKTDHLPNVQRVIQTTTLVKPANRTQKAYIDSIQENVITFVLGPAGTGKNLIALSQAIYKINSSSSPIEKIYYLRSNIGMSQERSLGALPGELNAKTAALAYPVLDNLIEFMPESQAKYLLENSRVEVLPIEMIRGRSFRNSFIIADECQNLTQHHLKTILSRISEGSKMVLLGDVQQCDFKDTAISGLSRVVDRLQDVEDVGVIRFTRDDIVRHPIIGHILARLDD